MNEIAFIRISQSCFVVARGPFEYANEPSRELGAIIAPDYLVDPDRIFLIPKSLEVIDAQKLTNYFDRPESELSISDWLEPSFESYSNVFEGFLKLIRSGELKKAVPVVFAEADCNCSNALLYTVVSKLIDTPRELIPYGLVYGQEILLGATPELLFSASADGIVRTCALAGTRSSSETENFAADHKENMEQSLVVQDLVARLSLLGETEVSERRVLSLPGMAHLKSDILCKCKSLPSARELIDILHPTGALGILPLTESNRSMLKDLDPSGQRKRLGAPFGYVLPGGEVFCIVAIRNIQAKGKHLLLGSGAGLVEQSKLSQEWQELALKRRTTLKMLLHD